MVDNYYQQEEDELWGENTSQDNLDNQDVNEQDDFNIDYSQSEAEETDDIEGTPEEDYITKLLKSKHIDRNKIRFQNEDGEIEEYKFDDLSDEDKFAILSEQEELPITDQQIEDLNTLSTQNMNLAEFVEAQKELAIKEYLAQNQTPQYNVDNLSDREVFVLDLINRYGEDLTDEEIDAEVDRAQENEEIFKKRVAKIRENFKAQEDASTQAALAQEEAKRAEAKKELQDAYVSAAMDLKEISGVQLEDSDRNEILDYLLLEDENNRTKFSSLFTDPNAVIKMAWYMLHGEEVYNATVDYYKKQLAEARRSSKPTKKTIIKETNSESDPYDLDKVFKRK